jgi:hypothetical protein
MSRLGFSSPRENEASRSSQRRAVSPRSRFDLIFDLVLFVGFAVAYTFNFTGLAIHEWFGLGFGAGLLVHLTLHWDWVVGTTKRLFTTPGRRRVMWFFDLLLLVDLTLLIASGVMISVVAIPALGFRTAAPSGYWTSLHVRTAEVAIVLIAIHVALDWRWVSSTTRRIFGLRPRARGADDGRE